MKKGAFQEEEQREKKLQRYETDHFLEPFAGLTPEYMEMSKSGAWKHSSPWLLGDHPLNTFCHLSTILTRQQDGYPVFHLLYETCYYDYGWNV